MKYIVTSESNKLMAVDSVGVYKAILDGRLKRYPKNFWNGEQGRENGLACAKYLIEEVLKCSDEDLKKLGIKAFQEYKLRGMLGRQFNGSPYNVINTLYEGRLHPWEMAWTPMGYWNNKVNRKKAFIWLMEKEDMQGDKIYKLNSKMFRRYGLTGLIDKYDGRLFEVIADLHPDEEIADLYKRKINVEQLVFSKC